MSATMKTKRTYTAPSLYKARLSTRHTLLSASGVSIYWDEETTAGDRQYARGHDYIWDDDDE